MRKLLTWMIAFAALGTFAACGSVSITNDAGPSDGGQTIDAGSTIDAGPTIDANDIDADPAASDAAAAPKDNAEITSGGMRVTGGVYTMDVMIGHPTSQAPSTGGGNSIEGGSAIKE